MWRFLVLTLCGALVVGVLAVRSAEVPTDSAFVGSASCERCHRDAFVAWSGSLHTQMMRRVSDKGAAVADLSADHPDLGFDPAEAGWGVGWGVGDVLSAIPLSLRASLGVADQE